MTTSVSGGRGTPLICTVHINVFLGLSDSCCVIRQSILFLLDISIDFACCVAIWYLTQNWWLLVSGSFGCHRQWYWRWLQNKRLHCSNRLEIWAAIIEIIMVIQQHQLHCKLSWFQNKMILDSQMLCTWQRAYWVLQLKWIGHVLLHAVVMIIMLRWNVARLEYFSRCLPSEFMWNQSDWFFW